MGQVPAFSSFLIIGDGRLARHLRRYFELEAIPFATWSRKYSSPSALIELSRKSSHLLLAISDSALIPFLGEHPELLERICVHFSGSQSLAEIPSAHPLMTFASDRLYDLATYQRIPFVLEKSRGHLDTLLPGLHNPWHTINSHDKGFYHALCALSGNFTVMLWEKAFHEFSSRFNLPKEVLLPYLEQIMTNLELVAPGASVLTGPLSRGDRDTVEKHLNELKDDPFREVYLAFVHAYEASRNKLPKDTQGGFR